MSSQDSKQMSGKAKMSDVLCFWVPESMTLDGIGTWPLVAFSESLHWAQQSWFNLAQLFAHYFNLKAPSIFMWFVALSILPYGIWRSGAANACEGQLLGLYIVDFVLLSLQLTQLLEKPKFLCLKQFSVILSETWWVYKWRCWQSLEYTQGVVQTLEHHQHSVRLINHSSRRKCLQQAVTYFQVTMCLIT